MAGCRLARFAPVAAQTISLFEFGGMFSLPVRPGHEFEIDADNPAKNQSLSIVRLAVKDGETWRIVLGCPTPEGVAFYREQKAQGERQQAEAARLIAAMVEPLRAEIKALVAENRRIDAIKR